jgi:hypothetical protein
VTIDVLAEPLQNGRVIRYTLRSGNHLLTWADCIENWQHNATYRDVFSRLLRDVPFAAYFWETPPVTRAIVNRAFEFILADSPELANVRADTQAFRDHFRSAATGDDIVTFHNLGGDALLVAPCPIPGTAGYAHMADFARHAPESQQHALWRTVGSAMLRHIGTQPTWLSTSGLGVYWLHLRLDSQPKYYTFQPYRPFHSDT